MSDTSDHPRYPGGDPTDPYRPAGPGERTTAAPPPGGSPAWDRTAELPPVRADRTYGDEATGVLPVAGASAMQRPDERPGDDPPYRRPRRRGGAGGAGALGIIGLAVAAFGAFALPLQDRDREVFFGNLRSLAAAGTASGRFVPFNRRGAPVGSGVATDWWRYGVFLGLGVCALMVLVGACVPVLRRAAGALLFLVATASGVGFVVAATQTNDYWRAVMRQGSDRLGLGDAAIGVWIAVAGCAVLLVAGLGAAATSSD